MSVFVPPTSWTLDNATLLASAVTPIASIPAGKKIYFTEIAPEVSLRNARLSQQVNSAAHMAFAVNQDVFEDNTLCEIFTKSVLGGYSALNNKKNKPMKHPFFKGLWAKDIISVTSMEAQDNTTNQYWQNYNLCRVDISFESLSYPVDQANGTGMFPYNPNWIEFKYTSGSNRVSTPVGWYRFEGGILPATFGTWKTQPYTNIQMTIYQCKRNPLFNVGDPTGIKPLYASNVGQVNANAWGDCAAETLLLDSGEVQPWQDWLGNKLYNVRLNLIYNEWGWNKTLTAAGNIERIVYFVGGGPPFVSFPFSALVNSLNPL